MKNFKLGIIGCGNMSQSIINGIIQNNADFKKSVLEIIVSDKNQSKLDLLNSFGYKNITTTKSNFDLVNSCDYILLAVKPQAFLETVKDLDLKSKTIISIMAGISIDKIIDKTKAKKIVKVMPNLNAKISYSFNSFTTHGLDIHENAFIDSLIGSFGINVKVAEQDFSSATGIAGCGPAFVFMFAKAFIDTAKKYGFSAEESVIMATQTIEGSIKHIASLPLDFNIDELIMSVCSKGGATIEGVNYLKEVGFENMVYTAIDKSISRVKELQQE